MIAIGLLFMMQTFTADLYWESKANTKIQNIMSLCTCINYAISLFINTCSGKQLMKSIVIGNELHVVLRLSPLIMKLFWFYGSLTNERSLVCHNYRL